MHIAKKKKKKKILRSILINGRVHLNQQPINVSGIAPCEFRHMNPSRGCWIKWFPFVTPPFIRESEHLLFKGAAVVFTIFSQRSMKRL